AGANQTITATYSGDGTYAGSFNTVNQTVTTPLTTTNTNVVSSGSASVAGSPVTFTATVTPIPDGGNVAFSGGGITTCGSQSIDGSGVATCTTTALSAGANQTITATYSGDGTYAGSFNTVNQTVTPPLTTTNTNVVSSGSASVAGSPVTFTATVTPIHDGGNVAFSGGGITTCGAKALNGSGVATCTTTALSAGANQTITDTYSGDGTYAGSFNTVNQTVTTATTTGVTGSPNPSTVGGSVTFTATVTPIPDGGNVAFSGGGITTCGATALTAGANQTITATYSGDTNFAGSTGTTTQTVNAPSTTSTVVSSSPNPS